MIYVKRYVLKSHSDAYTYTTSQSLYSRIARLFRTKKKGAKTMLTGKCIATGEELRVSEKDGHPLVIVKGPKIKVLGGVNPEVLKNAKKIRITLTRENPEDDFTGEMYQCLDEF